MPKKNKKKYSLIDRQNYHSNIMKKLFDKCTVTKGSYSKTNWDKFELAIKKSPKLQYSDGFTSNSNTDLSGRTKSFIKGYNAARKAEDKSRKIKF